MSIQAYVISLVIGLGVGVVYGLLRVQSPAPPIIALLGLLGMLLGESLVGYARGKIDAVSHCLHAKRFDVAAARKPDHPPPDARDAG